jgi:hypothetical protein
MLDLQELIIHNFVIALKVGYTRACHESKNDGLGDLIA